MLFTLALERFPKKVQGKCEICFENRDMHQLNSRINMVLSVYICSSKLINNDILKLKKENEMPFGLPVGEGDILVNTKCHKLAYLLNSLMHHELTKRQKYTIIWQNAIRPLSNYSSFLD